MDLVGTYCCPRLRLSTATSEQLICTGMNFPGGNFGSQNNGEVCFFDFSDSVTNDSRPSDTERRQQKDGFAFSVNK
jgi:hypothetical protein